MIISNNLLAIAASINENMVNSILLHVIKSDLIYQIIIITVTLPINSPMLYHSKNKKLNDCSASLMHLKADIPFAVSVCSIIHPCSVLTNNCIVNRVITAI